MTDAESRWGAADALRRGLPGSIAVSRLRVYDWPTADGLADGSPHLHTASTEGYVVLAGAGERESLSSRGLETTPLHPGAVVWFTPGTVHRLINTSGDLEILTLMSNAGLPEAGEELTLGRFAFRVASADARRLHALHVGVLGDA